MNELLISLLSFLPVAQDDPVTYEKELQPVAFLAGTFQGKGRSPLGEYDETISVEWAQNKTLLVLRSKSTVDTMTVFEDLRVFSYDPEKKRIRCRQFAMGFVGTYDVEVKEGGKTVVLNEAECEGKMDEWKYTFTAEEKGFSYRLETKAQGKFREYVKGTLTRKND